ASCPLRASSRGAPRARTPPAIVTRSKASALASSPNPSEAACAVHVSSATGPGTGWRSSITVSRSVPAIPSTMRCARELPADIRGMPQRGRWTTTIVEGRPRGARRGRSLVHRTGEYPGESSASLPMEDRMTAWDPSSAQMGEQREKAAPNEVRALTALAFEELRGLPGAVRDMHLGIAERAFRGVGPMARPVQIIHDALSRQDYETVGAGPTQPGRAADQAM